MKSRNRITSRINALRSSSSRWESSEKLETIYNAWVAGTFKADVAPRPQCQTVVVGTGKWDAQQPRTCIASLYAPLIKYLRVIGVCPVTIVRGNDTNYVSYEFKWYSWPTLYNLLVTLPFGGICLFAVIYNLCIGFRKDFAEALWHQGVLEVPLRNLSFIYEFSTRLIPVTYPLFSISASFGMLSAIPGILQLLNRWPAFQREYLNVFPHQGEEDPFIALKKYRDTTFLCFPFVSLLATLAVAVIMLDCESRRGCMFPKYFFGGPTTLAVLTMLIMIGSHSLHLFMYRTLTEVFNQVRLGIQHWSEGQGQTVIQTGRHEQGMFVTNAFQSKGSLAKNVRNWKTIMIFAKEQASLTGQSVALQHVLMILISFTYVCLGIFSVLSSKIGSAEGSNGLTLLMFATWGFSLLIVKAFICEGFVEQEKRIISLLRKLDVKEHVSCLIQLNSLINFIIEEPAEIRFWNVITLNKSFLLQLIGQVATYLIVLIQFDGIERDR